MRGQKRTCMPRVFFPLGATSDTTPCSRSWAPLIGASTHVSLAAMLVAGLCLRRPRSLVCGQLCLMDQTGETQHTHIHNTLTYLAHTYTLAHQHAHREGHGLPPLPPSPCVCVRGGLLAAIGIVKARGQKPHAHTYTHATALYSLLLPLACCHESISATLFSSHVHTYLRPDLQVPSCLVCVCCCCCCGLWLHTAGPRLLSRTGSLRSSSRLTLLMRAQWLTGPCRCVNIKHEH